MFRMVKRTLSALMPFAARESKSNRLTHPRLLASPFHRLLAQIRIAPSATMPRSPCGPVACHSCSFKTRHNSLGHLEGRRILVIVRFVQSSFRPYRHQLAARLPYTRRNLARNAGLSPFRRTRLLSMRAQIEPFDHELRQPLAGDAQLPGGAGDAAVAPQGVAHHRAFEVAGLDERRPALGASGPPEGGGRVPGPTAPSRRPVTVGRSFRVTSAGRRTRCGVGAPYRVIIYLS